MISQSVPVGASVVITIYRLVPNLRKGAHFPLRLARRDRPPSSHLVRGCCTRETAPRALLNANIRLSARLGGHRRWIYKRR